MPENHEQLESGLFVYVLLFWWTFVLACFQRDETSQFANQMQTNLKISEPALSFQSDSPIHVSCDMHANKKYRPKRTSLLPAWFTASRQHAETPSARNFLARLVPKMRTSSFSTTYRSSWDPMWPNRQAVYPWPIVAGHGPRA